MTDLIEVQKSDGVLTLTLNRPGKKNALTREMYDILGREIDAAATESSVRCILLQANGDTFTAGNDLADFAAVNAGEAPLAQERRGGSALVTALARTPVPVVAAVNGRAVGVGATLLLHCDLVFLSQDAQLLTPFVNLALVPEAASSILLPARIGHARAFAMFVLGEPLDAERALAWGMATAVFPIADLRDQARAAAQVIAAKPPAAVALTKRLMRDPDLLIARMSEEVGHFNAQLRSAEAHEAFAAFRERRPADFTALNTPAQ